MATTFPLNFPSVGGIKSVKFTPRDFVSETVSEFTGEQLIVSHTGQPKEAVITSASMKRPAAMEWITFLLELQGQKGTFLFGDPFNISPRGIGTGTPLIAGASETGQDINTDGWTTAQTGIILKGDWLQIGTNAASRLFQSLTDVNSDGGGLATLTLWPEIKIAFANDTPINVNSPLGLWRLQANERPWTVTPDGLYSFSIAIKEVL